MGFVINSGGGDDDADSPSHHPMIAICSSISFQRGKNDANFADCFYACAYTPYK